MVTLGRGGLAPLVEAIVVPLNCVLPAAVLPIGDVAAAPVPADVPQAESAAPSRQVPASIPIAERCHC